MRGYGRQVRAANHFEPAIEALTDEALRAKTGEFRERLKARATLDELIRRSPWCARRRVGRCGCVTSTCS